MTVDTRIRDLHADGEILGFDSDDGSPIYAGRQQRTLLKDVRPDLRGRVMATDEMFELIPANSRVVYTFIACGWGHTVEAKPRDYRRVTTCPYCEGKRTLPGFNDLETLYPDFVGTHWVDEKNELDPGLLAPKAKNKVHLRCRRGHEAEVSLAGRVTSWLQGFFSCRQCQGLNRALRSEVTLKSEYPDLALEWDPANDRRPHEVTPKAAYVAWWVCSLGHRWDEPVGRRTTYLTGCPYCSGHRVLAGFNDLATTRPETAAQWHPGNELDPTEVTAGSNIVVRWRCDEGHEWPAQVNYRNRNNCPTCARSEVSLVETLLWERVSDRIEDLEADVRVEDARDRRNRPLRCDAVVRGRRAVLEYDGSYWHRDRVDRDLTKTRTLLECGWSVIRVREDGLPDLRIEHTGFTQIRAAVWRIPTEKSLLGLDALADQIAHILTTIPRSALEQTNTKEKA